MQLLIEHDSNDGRPTFVLSVFHKKFQMIKVPLQKYPCNSWYLKIILGNCVHFLHFYKLQPPLKDYSLGSA